MYRWRHQSGIFKILLVYALPPLALGIVKRQLLRRICTEGQVIRVATPSEETINCRTKETLPPEFNIREFEKGLL
jgi:hypothetical protein